MNTIGFLDAAWRDLRYGARLLRLNPGFALVAILSLALGVGANTAIFQLLDAVRLRTLPVHDPQQLMEIRIADTTGGRTGQFSGRRPNLTNPLWERIRDRQQAFSSALAWSGAAFNLTAGGEARYAQGLWVSGDFFSTLGIPPLPGRVLTAADDRRGCAAPPAVISYGFWQREYARQPGRHRPQPDAERPLLRHRRRDAAELLRRRSRPRLRRGRPAVRRAAVARRAQRPRQERRLVSRGVRPAEAGLDARACERAARGDLRPDLPGDAAGALPRRGREELPRRSSSAPSTRRPASRRCAATTSRRCGCCSRPPAWCCSSPAPTSPT